MFRIGFCIISAMRPCLIGPQHGASTWASGLSGPQHEPQPDSAGHKLCEHATNIRFIKSKLVTLQRGADYNTKGYPQVEAPW